MHYKVLFTSQGNKNFKKVAVEGRGGPTWRLEGALAPPKPQNFPLKIFFFPKNKKNKNFTP